MQLADIYDVMNDQDKNAKYERVFQSLKERFGRGNYNSFDHEELFETIDCQSGYARKTYKGKIKPGIELTELELSMIIDNGFSHFGGSSVIRSDGSFTVVIYTD